LADRPDSERSAGSVANKIINYEFKLRLRSVVIHFRTLGVKVLHSRLDGPNLVATSSHIHHRTRFGFKRESSARNFGFGLQLTVMNELVMNDRRN
jgi:hypothetical protein